jgi:hypothetical protein
MNFELSDSKLPTEESSTRSLLPISETIEPVESRKLVSLKDGEVNHYFEKNSHSHGVTEHFTLPTEIDAMLYSFDLHAIYGMYELSFTTDEYRYASKNLSEEGAAKLEETIRKLIHSVEAKYPLEELYVRPAPEAASVRDIEDCIEEILLEEKYSTREELLKEYREKGWQHLFSRYHYLYNREFKRATVSHDRSAARGRLLQSLLKRALPEWEIHILTDQKWTLRKKSSG